MIRLPELINVRVPAQWELLQDATDFYHKKVVDLGCGYGDLMARIELEGGARYVFGYDNDSFMVDNTNRRFALSGLRSRVHRMNLDSTLVVKQKVPYDIAICFSVLPYLKNQGDLLWWMRAISKISFIEIQGAGDGPGTKTKYELYKYLTLFWPEVTLLGHTVAVKDQEYERYIWMCEG